MILCMVSYTLLVIAKFQISKNYMTVSENQKKKLPWSVCETTESDTKTREKILYKS